MNRIKSVQEPIYRVLLAALLLPVASGFAGSLKSNIQFNRDIRPILSDNCFNCHGPDKDKRKAKLRLDTREGLFTAIKERAPVVPGKPAESELYRRITSTDPDELMPKSKIGKKLLPRQIALLKQW